MDKDIESSNVRGWMGMIRLANICTNKVIDFICPGPSNEALRLQLGNKLICQKQKKLNKKDIQVQHEKLIDTIFNVLKKCKKRYISRRMLHAILCSSMKKEILKDECAKNRTQAYLMVLYVLMRYWIIREYVRENY